MRGFSTWLEDLPGEGLALEGFEKTKWVDFSKTQGINLSKASFLGKLADDLFVSGEWRNALSFYRSREELGRAILKANRHPKNSAVEWANVVAMGRVGMAHMLEVLEFREHVAKLHEANRENAGWAYRNRSRQIGKIWFEKMKLETGEVDDDTMSRIEKLAKNIADNPFLLSDTEAHAELLKVRALFVSKKMDEAWSELERIRAKHPTNDSVSTYWLKASLEHGRRPGLETILQSRLEEARKEGNKLGEITLYQLYATFLFDEGRLGEAIEIQEEALRLLRTFDIYTLVPRVSLKLAEMYETAGNSKRARNLRDQSAKMFQDGRPFPDHLKKEGLAELAKKQVVGKEDRRESLVDLQPRSSITAPLADFSAVGLFVLKNPGLANVSGNLQLKGNHQKSYEVDDFGVYRVSIDAASPTSQESLIPVEIQAGATVMLDLATTRPNGTREGALKISWLPQNGDPQEAEWKYLAASDESEQRAIIEAGLFRDNPFHSIPIYHTIQSQTALNEPIDIRIEASATARIEVYDSTGRLVLIDANGNGSLDDPGDVLGHDATRNGIPDLGAEDETVHATRFLMQINPAGKIPTNGLELKLSIRDQTGEWIEISRDRILPPQTKK